MRISRLFPLNRFFVVRHTFWSPQFEIYSLILHNHALFHSLLYDYRLPEPHQKPLFWAYVSKEGSITAVFPPFSYNLKPSVTRMKLFYEYLSFSLPPYGTIWQYRTTTQNRSKRCSFQNRSAAADRYIYRQSLIAFLKHSITYCASSSVILEYSGSVISFLYIS